MIRYIRIYSCLFALSLFALSSFAQQREQMLLKQVRDASAQMRTLRCDFTQTQRLKMLAAPTVSKGYMLYKKPNSLRWQYETPTSNAFIVNRGKANNRNAAYIARLMLKSISGKSLADAKTFYYRYSISGDLFRVAMTPRSTAMRRYMTSVVMDFDIHSSQIRTITINNNSGSTFISFHGFEVNRPIGDDQFQLR